MTGRRKGTLIYRGGEGLPSFYTRLLNKAVRCPLVPPIIQKPATIRRCCNNPHIHQASEYSFPPSQSILMDEIISTPDDVTRGDVITRQTAVLTSGCEYVYGEWGMSRIIYSSHGRRCTPLVMKSHAVHTLFYPCQAPVRDPSATKLNTFPLIFRYSL